MKKLTIIIVLCQVSLNFYCQIINSISFANGKQLGLADSVMPRVNVGTNSSIPFFEGYVRNFDTLNINIKSCEGMLAFYNTHTVPCTLPPQPAGKYKVVAKLKCISHVADTTCSKPHLIVTILDSIEVGDKYTSITNANELVNSFRFFPSPVRNKLTLDYDHNRIVYHKITISNSLGQTMLASDESNREIELSFLEAGIYYLLIEWDSGFRSFKFIKE